MSTHQLSEIHIVAQDPEVRNGLAALVESDEWLARPYASVTDYLAHGARAHCGCVIVHVAMAAGGTASLQALWSSETDLPVIVISAPADIETAVNVMKHGAFDCLELPFHGYDLLECTAAALRQCAANRRTTERTADLRERAASLTAREREVMAMLAVGTINKVIASRLGLSRRTVETHRCSLMKKMGAASIAQLINMYLALENLKERRTRGVRSETRRLDAVT